MSMSGRGQFGVRLVVETAVAAIGAALLAGAAAADQTWFDRHFMPVFFLPHAAQSRAEMAARAVVGVLGLAVALFLRKRAGKFVATRSMGAVLAAMLRLTLAVLLALVASEAVLRSTFWRAIEAPPADEEPLRRPDPKLGWVFVPARTGTAKAGGREIAYSFDESGYRVRGPGIETDPERPTLVFTGESIIAGYGLNWEESIPAQVEALTDLQSADLAVFGYANDQAYLKLKEELPRFRQPVAIISIFAPTLFDRNFGDDRPHLDDALTWLPARAKWRLTALLDWLVPYRSAAALERGIGATRAVLRATVELARARGAEPLIIVPRFGPESATEEMLRRRILDEPGLPYIAIELDPSWHLPGDSHPNPRAAEAIAAAIATRLQAR
jgi:hypothetical protein